MRWYKGKCAAIAAFFWVAYLSLTGCGLPPRTERQVIDHFGYFEFHAPREGREGVVVGAPHGLSDAGSAEVARKIGERLGAGLVIAFGFKRRHLAVAQPIFYSHPLPDNRHDPLTRGSAFLEYRRLLDRTAHGNLGFYIEIHRAKRTSKTESLEVATSGFTFEDLQALKESYLRIRDRCLRAHHAVKVPIAIDPLDKIGWRVSGIKNHGTLLVAERGLSLRIPGTLSPGQDETIYIQILSSWLHGAIELIKENLPHLPQIEVKRMGLGRIDMIPSRLKQFGIVIGAPHGSFDEHTAEFVFRMSHQTGFAAVVARGFTPVEANGWRINVNRPTEKTFTSAPEERRSERAERIYHAYKSLVLEAARERLVLYVDVHQYAPGKKIQVATSGVSLEEAHFLKTRYQAIRDRMVQQTPGIAAVGLDIEPLDRVEIRALAAKSHGILAVAKKSLHFELPAQNLLNSSEARAAYAKILSELLTGAAPRLANPQKAVDSARQPRHSKHELAHSKGGRGCPGKTTVRSLRLLR